MKESMVNITVYIPKKYRDYLEKIISYGLFASKSEAVRCCIEEMIPKFQHDINCIEELLKIEDVVNLIKFLKTRGFIVKKNPKNEKLSKKSLGNRFWNDVVTREGEIIKIPIDDENGWNSINSSTHE